MKIAKNLTHFKGDLFEHLACIILFMKGYKILKRNFKISSTAQIDILALKNDVISIVEVKFRKKMENSLIAISYSQANRLKASRIQLAKKYKKQVVIDAMFFSLDKPYCLHKKNIF